MNIIHELENSIENRKKNYEQVCLMKDEFLEEIKKKKKKINSSFGLIIGILEFFENYITFIWEKLKKENMAEIYKSFIHQIKRIFLLFENIKSFFDYSNLEFRKIKEMFSTEIKKNISIKDNFEEIHEIFDNKLNENFYKFIEQTINDLNGVFKELDEKYGKENPKKVEEDKLNDYWSNVLMENYLNLGNDEEDLQNIKFFFYGPKKNHIAIDDYENKIEDYSQKIMLYEENPENLDEIEKILDFLFGTWKNEQDSINTFFEISKGTYLLDALNDFDDLPESEKESEINKKFISEKLKKIKFFNQENQNDGFSKFLTRIIGKMTFARLKKIMECSVCSLNESMISFSNDTEADFEFHGLYPSCKCIYTTKIAKKEESKNDDPYF